MTFGTSLYKLTHPFKGIGYGDFRFRENKNKISLNKLNGLKNSDTSNTVNKHWGGSKGESPGNTGFRDEINNQNNQILGVNGRTKLVQIDDKVVPYNTAKNNQNTKINNNQILEVNGRTKLVNVDDKIVPYNTKKIEKSSGKNHGFREISIDTNESQKEHNAIDTTQGIHIRNKK